MTLTVNLKTLTGEAPRIQVIDPADENQTVRENYSLNTGLHAYTFTFNSTWSKSNMLVFANGTTTHWSADVTLTEAASVSVKTPVYTGREGHHVVDPNIMYYQGAYYMVYHQRNFFGDFADTIATSTDLLNWTDMANVPVGNGGSLGFSPNAPFWFTDQDGIHLITIMYSDDPLPFYTEVHPNLSDASTWGDPANWSGPVPLRDHTGAVLTGQDAAILKEDGTYKMMYSLLGAIGPFVRTSSSLLSGWSEGVDLTADTGSNQFPTGPSEQYGLTAMPSGNARMYWADIHQIYYAENINNNFNLWANSIPITYHGFPFNLGWGRPVRFTDSAVISNAENLITPRISNITSTKDDGAYKAGTVIGINLTFSGNVTSTGSATIHFDTGGSCSFTVTNSNIASCNYTVGSGESSSDLNVSSVSGTITGNDELGNNMVNFTPVTNLAANKNLVIDNTSPVLTTSPAQDTSTDTSSIVISGSATDLGSSIASLAMNGVPISSPGNFSATASLSLGSNTINIVALDAAGNSTTKTLNITRINQPLAQASTEASTPSSAVENIVSKVAAPSTVAPVTDKTVTPSVDLIIVDGDTGVATQIYSDQATIPSFTTQTPTLRGVTTPNSEVVVEIHSDPITLTTTSDQSGNWSITFNQPLELGQHTATVTTKNPATKATLSTHEYKFSIVSKAQASNADASTTEKTTTSSTLLIWLTIIATIIGGYIVVLMIRKRKQ